MSFITHKLDAKKYARQVASHVALACATISDMRVDIFLPREIYLRENGYNKKRAIATLYHGPALNCNILLEYNPKQGWLLADGEFYNAVYKTLSAFNISFDKDSTATESICRAGQDVCLQL